MNTEMFVDLIKLHVRDAAIEDTLLNLKNPPGKRISPDERIRSDWFNRLSENDASLVESMIACGVEEAIFGLFAILDGSRVIYEGRFELTYINNDESVLLNDPEKVGLNEIFNAQ